MPPDRPLPPLTTLRIFEAAARRQSFLLAAAELNLTPGAVSKQVKQLEGFLGRPLFERRHREVRLTEAGGSYFKGIAQAFAELRAVTHDAMERPDRDSLVLWCAPWFLKAWLLPRLDRFQDIRAGTKLDILTGETSDRVPPTVNVSIRLGLGAWPKLRSELLMPQEVVAVCTPGYLRREKLSAPYSFEKFVVLDSANTPGHFESWQAAAGLAGREPRKRIVFQSNETAFSAAQSGHGLALVNPRFAETDLAAGKLVRPWRATTRTDKHYWLTYQDRFPLPPPAETFRRWLLTELDRPT